MWNRQFIKASIREQGTVFILTIQYSWYWLQYYDEVFICNSSEEAKTKLLHERTHDHLTIIDKLGIIKNMTII